MTDDGGDYDEGQAGHDRLQRGLAAADQARRRGARRSGTPRASALKERGLDASEFRVEDYGAPPYPEVVLVTARKTLDAKRARDRVGALDAIARRRRGDARTAGRGGGEDREGGGDGRHRAGARAARRGAAAVRRRPEATARRARAWADFDARIGLVEDAPRRGRRRSSSRCAASRCEAPERCHRPGCHRSIVVAAYRAARLQSRVWRAVRPPAGCYVLAVRRINHVVLAALRTSGVSRNRELSERSVADGPSLRAGARRARSCPRPAATRPRAARRAPRRGRPARAARCRCPRSGRRRRGRRRRSRPAARRSSARIRTRSSDASACLTALVRISATTK